MKHLVHFKPRRLFIIILLVATAISFWILIKALTMQFQTKIVRIIPTTPLIIPSPTPKDMSIAALLSNNEPVSIALIGYGGLGHDGGYLTDTLILLTYVPKTHTIKYIPIPRDIWVELPVNPNAAVYHKINSAYAYGFDTANYPNRNEKYKGKFGGYELLSYALEQISGIQISGYIGIDFSSFVSVIDTIGGIDIVVDKTFTDEQYPITGHENDLCGKNESDLPELLTVATEAANLIFPCRYETLHFEKGPVHLSGAEALKFARSRHSREDGSDFGRSERQKKIIIAALSKLVSTESVTKLPSLLTTLNKSVTTNIPLSLLANALEIVPKGIPQIESFQINDDNFLDFAISDDKQSILIPKFPTSDWSVLNDRIRAFTINEEIQIPIIELQFAASDKDNIASIASAFKKFGFQASEKIVRKTPLNIAQLQTKPSVNKLGILNVLKNLGIQVIQLPSIQDKIDKVPDATLFL